MRRSLGVFVGLESVSTGSLASIAADRERFPELPAASRSLRDDERWREKLRFMAARLEAARGRSEGGYPDAQAYLADLELLQETLSASGLPRLARGALEDARRRGYDGPLERLLAVVETKGQRGAARQDVREVAPRVAAMHNVQRIRLEFFQVRAQMRAGGLRSRGAVAAIVQESCVIGEGISEQFQGL